MKKRLAMLTALLTLAALTVAACGGGEEAAAPEADGKIRIELDEYSFSPAELQLTAGEEVTLVLVNVGEKEHEFMAGNNVMMMDGAPGGFNDDFLSPLDPMVTMPGMAMGDMDDGEMDHPGFGVIVAVGETVEVTFTVPASMVGEWEFGCFEDDGAHWDEGMKGKMVVS